MDDAAPDALAIPLKGGDHVNGFGLRARDSAAAVRDLSAAGLSSPDAPAQRLREHVAGTGDAAKVAPAARYGRWRSLVLAVNVILSIAGLAMFVAGGRGSVVRQWGWVVVLASVALYWAGNALLAYLSKEERAT